MAVALLALPAFAGCRKQPVAPSPKPPPMDPRAMIEPDSRADATTSTATDTMSPASDARPRH
jgi:hypothetical protein